MSLQEIRDLELQIFIFKQGILDRWQVGGRASDRFLVFSTIIIWLTGQILTRNVMVAKHRKRVENQYYNQRNVETRYYKSKDKQHEQISRKKKFIGQTTRATTQKNA
jgi:hypothetical protein